MYQTDIRPLSGAGMLARASAPSIISDVKMDIESDQSHRGNSCNDVSELHKMRPVQVTRYSGLPASRYSGLPTTLMC